MMRALLWRTALRQPVAAAGRHTSGASPLKRRRSLN